MSTTKDLRINEKIRVREVRLIDDNGDQRILSLQEALQLAKDATLDLVEVAPNASPPVCKILDFGKYRFEQEKKNRELKKKQTVVKLKEVRMQPKIEKHDMEFKTKHIQDFLGEGDKVKVTIRFRGREMAHPERGRQVLDKVLEILDGLCIVESPPKMEGRFMSMLLGPKVKK